MRKLWLLILMAMFVSACSTDKQSMGIEAPITVDFGYQPTDIKVGEVTTLQVVVKQGNDLVSDAGDVKFEVWKDGQEKHEMIDAENKGKGVYIALEKFHDPSVYHIMYHVTAREMHKMELKDIQVK